MTVDKNKKALEMGVKVLLSDNLRLNIICRKINKYMDSNKNECYFTYYRTSHTFFYININFSYIRQYPTHEFLSDKYSLISP